jgi:hypothetical protein
MRIDPPSPLVGEGSTAGQRKLGRVRGPSPRTPQPKQPLTRPRFARPPSPTRGEGRPFPRRADASSQCNADVVFALVGQINVRFCAIWLSGNTPIGGKSCACKSSFRKTFQCGESYAPSISKFFYFVFTENVHHSRIPPRSEGRTRGRHDTRGGVAVDVLARSACVARTNDADADVKSCGPGAPTLALSRRAMSLLMTVANKPGTPGRSRINVKTIARGRPGPRLNLWFCRVLFAARGPWGQPAPAFPAPSRLLEGHVDPKLGRMTSRDCERVSAV